MSKFRKKPVTIEASQWFKDGDHPAVVPYEDQREGKTPLGWVPTLEGGHIVTPGDWIITGIKGEHYPCKPNIFSETYESANTDDTEYVYVTQSVDWADEFDTYGCFVAKKRQFEINLQFIKKAFKDGRISEDDEFYFGTNEGVQFASYTDLIDTLTIDPCSAEFYKEFIKLNNGPHFGTTFVDDLLERALEEED